MRSLEMRRIAVFCSAHALLVPALLSLFGRDNWWLPAGIARILCVPPSPVRPDPRSRPSERDLSSIRNPEWSPV